MLKAAIMRAANRLCDMIEFCGDESFADKVVSYVAWNERFDDEEIEAAEAAESEED